MTQPVNVSRSVADAPRWFSAGDINGFFGLMVDNLAVMGFLAAVLVGVYQMPADVVFGRMFPGTALGVLVGDLLYTWMAVRLARRSGNASVTAMPLGIDTPTTIGLAFLVLGPAFVAFKQQGLDEHAAAIATWQLGMAGMMVMGVFKFVLSFVGAAIGRAVPRAGLLGAIAAIALMLIGFLPMLEVLSAPIVGMATLGVILYAVVARGRLPGKVPGVFAAFLLGTALYYTLGPLGLIGPGFHAPDALALRFALPVPTLAFIDGFAATVPYLPLYLPFGLLMVIGGINNAESARAAGDDFNTRDILLVEAISTLVAGLCGGVAQTTPYIGHPAYKKMGARAGYTLLTGVFIGVGGVVGYLSTLVEVLPLAVLAPILVFVSIEMTTQAFEASPPHHATAVAFSFFPAIARLLAIKLGDPNYVSPARFDELMHDHSHGLPELALIVALGNGFIITSMLWGGFLVALIDRRHFAAVMTLAVAALLTLFGIIHSVEAGGGMYLPWHLDGVAQTLCYQFAAAYAVLAMLVGLLSLQRQTMLAIVTLAAIGFGNASQAAECAKPARLMARVQLFFGAALADGQPLPEAEWLKFIDEEVTPRFPEGLTELSGRGQWRRPDGAISREPSRVLMLWYSPARSRDADIEAVRAAYKARFKQQSVMRVDGVDCVSF
jgi:AGZA family xanthine/uracil permease-like MFS transporter